MFEEADALLLDLLNIPSVNGKDNEGKVAQYLQAYFQQNGIDAVLQPIDENHTNVIAQFAGGDSSRHLLINGHLDTVPYGEMESWSTNPAEAVCKDGKVYARGASDMKSGLAALVYSLVMCHKKGMKFSCPITFVGTCDEEKGGLGAQAFLESAWFPEATEVLIGEPTALQLGIAQKGCLWLELSFKGISSHGAYPEKGLNAIEQGVRFATALQEKIQTVSHPVLGHSTAQITEISGGTAPNMTPDSCRILMDIRMVPGQNVEEILKDAENLLQSKFFDSRLTCQMTVKNERMSVSISKDDPLTLQMEKALRKMGEKASYMGINYFTDASVLLKKLPGVGVLLFGPGDPELCHQTDEYVEIERYHKAINILMEYFSYEY